MYRKLLPHLFETDAAEHASSVGDYAKNTLRSIRHGFGKWVGGDPPTPLAKKAAQQATQDKPAPLAKKPEPAQAPTQPQKKATLGQAIKDNPLGATAAAAAGAGYVGHLHGKAKARGN